MEIKDYVKQFLETYGTSGKAEDYVKQFLETYGTSGKAERVTCRRVTRK